MALMAWTLSGRRRKRRSLPGTAFEEPEFEVLHARLGMYEDEAVSDEFESAVEDTAVEVIEERETEFEPAAMVDAEEDSADKLPETALEEDRPVAELIEEFVEASKEEETALEEPGEEASEESAEKAVEELEEVASEESAEAAEEEEVVEEIPAVIEEAKEPVSRVASAARAAVPQRSRVVMKPALAPEIDDQITEIDLRLNELEQLVDSIEKCLAGFEPLQELVDETVPEAA